MTQPDPDNEATFQVCVIPSDQKQTTIAKDAIVKELERFQYGEDASFGIKLALEEALANAVKHGNMDDPGKQVTVRFAVNAEKAVVVVRDEGPGFEPEQVPDCTHPERLPLPNGRGIMLIRSYMDEVCYRNEARDLLHEASHLIAPGRAGVPMAENDISPSRRTVLFTGRVQGVGFRHTAQIVATSYKVTGTVRNLADGRVEMIAEGASVELTRFQAAVEEAMHGNIRNAAATDGPATGEFSSFGISF